MKKHIAIVIAVAMLTLAGCSENNDPSTDSGAGSSSGDASVAAKTTTDTTEASSDAETTTTTEAATAEAPKSPFADGIETPIDGVRLGMRADDITAMFGEPSYKSEMDGVYYYNTDSVTAFSETYNAGSSIEFIFDSDGYLSVVNFNLGGQFKDDGQFERTGTYSDEQQKADFDKLYAIICEKAGEPTHKNNQGAKKSCYTWTSDDLETNPTEYFIDEGAVDGLYANYVSFYIIADTSSNKMPFSSLLSDEEIAAGKMSEKDTAAAESKGDSMAFAQIEDCIYKALSAHADDPFTTEDEGFKLGEAIANDLEAGGFEFGEYTGSNFYNAGGKFSNVSPNVKSTGTYKTPYSPKTVSEVEGITLKEVAIERLENLNTYTSYLRVSLEYSIDDGSDVELRNKTYTKLFTYFSQNGYKDTDDATDKLSDTLKFFADGGDRKTKFCKLRDDKFNKIEVTTSNESCSIVFYK